MRLFYRCCIIFAIQPGLIATLNLFALPYSDWDVRDPRRKPESRWRTTASHGPRLSPGVTHLTSRYGGRSGPSLLSPPSAPPDRKSVVTGKSESERADPGGYRLI